ncbi:alpha-amylase family glycosyl hydrolase [Patescibacteria group bacterium]|nr:alpha-amylase family glycosyl hydrolase [Patescibacteria group bacterium]
MSWLENAVFYQIFIDRFAGFKTTDNWEKPDYLGGNIKGIISKLDYINDLGINAIWITPFNKGIAYHGYHITDFYGVDEHFGTEADLKDLIKKAHDKGIRIVFDFVPNHCSNKHPYFLDAINDKDSKYRDWFSFESWPNDYQCFSQYKELPKLNLDNEEVRQHLLGSARKWLGIGFDGARIDHIVGISNENIKAVIKPLREEFPEAVFIGEAWIPRNAKLQEMKLLHTPYKYLICLFQWNSRLYKNYAGILDGILDFETAQLLEKYATSGSGKYKSQIVKKIVRHRNVISHITFLDNHDMERFLYRCGDDINKLKKAATLQFLLQAIPMIYYGTEIGMSQTKPFSSLNSYNDILAREPMWWEKPQQNSKLLDFYKNLIKKRSSK